MPFMDWRLVCLGFALPSTSKIGGGVTKRVLREAIRGRMPESLRVRMDKVGFAPPTAQWFNGALGPWVIDQVDTQSFLGSTVWDGPAIREFVHQRAARGPWTSRTPSGCGHFSTPTSGRRHSSKGQGSPYGCRPRSSERPRLNTSGIAVWPD